MIFYKFIRKLFDRKTYPLNELLAYGIIGSMLHLHIVPKDIKEELLNGKDRRDEFLDYSKVKLVDALTKIKVVLLENKKLDKVFAISPLLKLQMVQDIFLSLGFEVKRVHKPFFSYKFPNAKEVWSAKLTREKLLETEFE